MKNSKFKVGDLIQYTKEFIDSSGRISHNGYFGEIHIVLKVDIPIRARPKIGVVVDLLSFNTYNLSREKF